MYIKYILLFVLWQHKSYISFVYSLEMPSNEGYRFSAHWAKIKCSICSSKFDRFERDHVSLPWSNDFLSRDWQFRQLAVLPVKSRSGIALPPETARSHPIFWVVIITINKYIYILHKSYEASCHLIYMATVA